MRLRQRGFTLVELLIAIAIISLLITIAIINVRGAQQNANELAVMREVQTVFQAQVQYMSQFGEFASNLAQLGPPFGDAVVGPQAAKLLPASLASGQRNGYIFTLVRTPGGFTVNAN